MSRYLIQGTYTAEGAKGLLKQGGTSRRSQIEEMLKGLGGSLEAFYWAAKLGKTNMTGYQASARGGVVRVRLQGDRVGSGHIPTYELFPARSGDPRD